jgi:Domain of unknown function (DUF4397)
MKYRFFASRAARSLAVPALGIATLLSGLVGLAAPAASAAQGAGWIRLAHLSPNTPAVDVYLYSFNDPHAMIVLKHVGYGAVSPYEKVAGGSYTVAMRGAGAPASSQPVLSTNVQIAAGGAYTVAGMGPASGLRLQVLRDRLTTPGGKSLVRVIQASLREHTVTVSAGSHVLAQDVAFAHVTSYAVSPPGTFNARAAGSSESVSQQITLDAGTIHTLVVLDSSKGLKLDNLEDAAGSAVLPQGGAATGFGGTAGVPAPSPLPWFGLMALGALATFGGLFRVARLRAAAAPPSDGV